ncbi:GroES-like protein [Onchocerca flexuosa]|uniref:Enoyl-[acyl-carrier-protein] reductase, mitochondrial n=1 Tax=Onchocerca flexuosa TaxID=387005 RepID=A0A238BID9_9BILA|nr:GroES-like protein [Onchocerca flexuosa]
MARNMAVCHRSCSYRCLTSKQLVYDSYGDPEKVLYLREVEIDSKPGLDKVRVRFLASPVNPADINQVQGVYPIKLPLPAVGGNEMIGEVEEVGDGTSELSPGDRVIASHAGIGTWQTYANINEKDLIKIDRDLSLEASAFFQVNPPTAYRMLRDFVKLRPGDLIVQNGGNSAVGRAVIQLAKAWGYRTMSLIRERSNFAEVADELKMLGADYVLTENELLKEIKTKANSARLALNCVGGRSTLLLINCLENDGVMVTYGGMSKQPIQVINFKLYREIDAPTGPFIFKNIQLHGFWMSHWYTLPENEVKKKKMFSELANLIRNRELRPTNFYKIKLDDWQKAISNTINSLGGKQLFVH